MNGRPSQGTNDVQSSSPEIQQTTHGAGEISSSGLPLVEELNPCPDVADLLTLFRDQSGLLVLESSLRRAGVGRYSFLAADPFAFILTPRVSDGESPFEEIRQRLSSYCAERVEGLPPFQGGAAGLFSYELGHAWEQWPRARHDEFGLPDLAIGIYDWVIAWDHQESRAWIISQGFPETQLSRRTDRAAQRLAWVKQCLEGGLAEGTKRQAARAIPLREPAEQWPVSGLSDLTSDFSHAGYLQAVEKVIEYIHAGDIFQANLSQRLLYPLRTSPLSLYRRLRQLNPAPFAGYFTCEDWAIVSASPERFLNVREGEVQTRPIKGTRGRRIVPEADLYSRDELRASVKDQAENVMIVDLLRNDLSRVCKPGTVRVADLCAVESYETVQHLVSEIRAQLAPEYDIWDLLTAAFPGGSITGAPKVRAMEIIAELEPTARGPYCGSLSYVGFDGTVDGNILIRTFTCRHGWVQCPVGGGIVAQSDPQAEYEETLHKAAGMLRALGH